MRTGTVKYSLGDTKNAIVFDIFTDRKDSPISDDARVSQTRAVGLLDEYRVQPSEECYEAVNDRN